MADFVNTIIIGETEVPVYDTPSRQQVSISRNIVVPVASWVADTTYEECPFRAAIAIQDITEDHYAIVNFAPDYADSSDFSRHCDSFDGGVYIYAVEIPADAITIPVITFYKEV